MSRPNNVAPGIAVPGGAPTSLQAVAAYLTTLGNALAGWIAQASNAINWLLGAATPPVSGANVALFGADPTGATDCSLAFTQAIAASPLVIIPKGTYYFAHPLSINIPAGVGLTFQGAGSEVTLLRFAPGDGFQVTYGSQLSTLRMSGFSFLTQGQGSGNGLTITQTGATGPSQPISLLSDLCFRGSDGFGVSNYWTIGIYINGASWFTYYNCNFTGAVGPLGTGIQTAGNVAAVSVVHNLLSCNFYVIGNGFVMGSYTQGVTMNACNYTGVALGVWVPAGGAEVSQLGIINSQFYATGPSGAISVQAAMDGLNIHGCYIFCNTSSIGINIANLGMFAIIGNRLAGSGGATNGIIVGTYGSGAGVISGNTVSACTTGVWLTTPSQFVNVQSNVYSGNGNNTLNQGTNNTVGGGSA